MSQDILIVVDCQAKLSNNTLPSSAVKMYAASSDIVVSGQGTNEIWVKVPTETNLRWRAVPLQMSQGLPENQRWEVMITRVKLWGANASQNQLDAAEYLQDWTADGGLYAGVAYKFPGIQHNEQLTFSPEVPPPNGSSESQVVGVQTDVQVRDPYVQCTTYGAMDVTSGNKPRAAYSFTCSIYQNGKPYATVTWDPFVTVTLS